MRRSCAKTASLYSPGVPMLCDNDPFLHSHYLPYWHLNSFSLPPPLSLQVVPSAWLGITLALKCHVSHRAHDLGIHSQLCCQISSPLTKYSPKQDYFQLSYNPSRLNKKFWVLPMMCRIQELFGTWNSGPSSAISFYAIVYIWQGHFPNRQRWGRAEDNSFHIPKHESNKSLFFLVIFPNTYLKLGRLVPTYSFILDFCLWYSQVSQGQTWDFNLLSAWSGPTFHNF